MNKKALFVLLAILMMAVMTVSVSADQDGYNRYCNMDQYGCWVTGDDGAQNYIMFWSEEARTYFMGPNSNAVVTDYCADCNGQLGMGSGAPTKYVRPLTAEELELIKKYNEEYKQKYGKGTVDYYQSMLDYYTNNPDDLSKSYSNFQQGLELSTEEKVEKIAEHYNMAKENYSYEKYKLAYEDATVKDYDRAIDKMYNNLQK